MLVGRVVAAGDDEDSNERPSRLEVTEEVLE